MKLACMRADPLGLDRASNRLTSDMLTGISALRARARYYSFYVCILRQWFCDELGKIGAPDRYVDAFCGRVLESVLAKRYSDFAHQNLNEICERAGLRVVPSTLL